jgi:hypothetical protein
MKKLLFFAFLSLNLCFITGNQVSAQNKQAYQPMALEGAHWWVNFWDTNFPPWAPGDNYQYVIRGDSVLSDVAYKKVYNRNMTDHGQPLINKIRILNDIINKY